MSAVSRILLVEDDAMIREAFTIILQLRDNYVVTVAENGSIAIDLCKQHSYDVILLDIMMPVMDGIEFLKQYRSLLPNASSKIIIMSNLSSGSELSEAQDYGIERSVLKSSLTPGVLMSLVENALESGGSIAQNIDTSANDDSSHDESLSIDSTS